MKFDTDGTYRVYINDNLYFERWYDDMSQDEDTIIRDIKTGEVIKNIKGKLIIMPNNDIWQI